MISEREKPFALHAFDLALVSLEEEVSAHDARFPILAATAVAQAIQESGRFTSKAFREHGNWLGISPAPGQPAILGDGVDRIRDFRAETIMNHDHTGRTPDARCFAAWAYLVCISTNYHAARAEMMALWDSLENSPTRAESAAKGWLNGMAPVYCERDPNYARDVIGIFEREVLPLLRAEGKL
jgi:hypothetical protein